VASCRVGREVNAVLPLVKVLREHIPSMFLTVTTTSVAGRKRALEKAGADRVHLAPLDAKSVLKRAFDSIRPRLLLVAETEFWPLTLLEAKARGVPVLLVNGRVSDRSYPSYRLFRPFFKKALGSFSACLVQTRTDKDRLVALGVQPDVVWIAGQMKHDLPSPDRKAVQDFGEWIGLAPHEPVVTFGSLREREDEAVLKLLPAWLSDRPGVRVILAPRHFNRLDLYSETLDRAGILWQKRTQIPPVLPWRVLVLDTLGELELAYALSRAAFVGGTLVSVGGHNVMEPALSGVPVIFGPQTANVREAAGALVSAGGGFMAPFMDSVLDKMDELMNEEVSRDAGRRARDSMETLRGATHRTAERVLEFIR
jgi:3-deoxy-D-manno-octulosonic-acid transferase